jgi:hypothetical protein
MGKKSQNLGLVEEGRGGEPWGESFYCPKLEGDPQGGGLWHRSEFLWTGMGVHGDTGEPLAGAPAVRYFVYRWRGRWLLGLEGRSPVQGETMPLFPTKLSSWLVGKMRLLK